MVGALLAPLALAVLDGSRGPSQMSGFGSSMLALTDASILDRLKTLYATKLRPLEQKSLYHEIREPQLSDAWFDARPMVLLIGQYSVGKTSFIRYLLGRDFPNQHVGPEPTTDRFVAVMYGEREKVTPGNALTSQPDTPFHSLRHFGTHYLDKLEATSVPAPILRRISLVDTPGVQAGEKQKGGRGYNFEEVIKWWAQHSDRILVLFDPNKLDISDEFREVRHPNTHLVAATHATASQPHLETAAPRGTSWEEGGSQRARAAGGVATRAGRDTRCARAWQVIEILRTHQSKVRQLSRTRRGRAIASRTPHQPTPPSGLQVRVILNKADEVEPQKLMRVYGALMWSLGSIVKSPEVRRRADPARCASAARRARGAGSRAARPLLTCVARRSTPLL
jgi:hypothetical protein